MAPAPPHLTCMSIGALCKDDPRLLGECLTDLVDFNNDGKVDDADLLEINKQTNVSDSYFTECAIDLAEHFPDKVPPISQSLLINTNLTTKKLKSHLIKDIELHPIGCKLQTAISLPKNIHESINSISLTIYNRLGQFSDTFFFEDNFIESTLPILMNEYNVIEWNVYDANHKPIERKYFTRKGDCSQMMDGKIISLFENPEKPGTLPDIDPWLVKEIFEDLNRINRSIPKEHRILAVYWDPKNFSDDIEPKGFKTNDRIIHLQTDPKDEAESHIIAWYEAMIIVFNYLEKHKYKFVRNSAESVAARYKLFDEEFRLQGYLDTILSFANYGSGILYDQPHDAASLFANIATILRFNSKEFMENLFDKQSISKRDISSLKKTMRIFLELYNRPKLKFLKKYFNTDAQF